MHRLEFHRSRGHHLTCPMGHNTINPSPDKLEYGQKNVNCDQNIKKIEENIITNDGPLIPAAEYSEDIKTESSWLSSYTKLDGNYSVWLTIKYII